MELRANAGARPRLYVSTQKHNYGLRTQGTEGRQAARQQYWVVRTKRRASMIREKMCKCSAKPAWNSSVLPCKCDFELASALVSSSRRILCSSSELSKVIVVIPTASGGGQ